MYKSIFNITKMDCPSEEYMIRSRLAEVQGIASLDFDIPNRLLTVYHTHSADDILQELAPLNFNALLQSSVTVTDASYVATSNNGKQDRTLLWQVLLINLLFFGVESISGWLSGSMGLVADSLDMLADALVYGMALLAVGHSAIYKQRTATVAGILQLVLAVAGFVEVIRRFVQGDILPNITTMIGISLLALIGNALCLYLLQKSKSRDVHMQASVIFTSNDVIVNLGVIVAGILTYFTQSRYPDLIIGLIVFGIVANGAVKILKLSGIKPKD